MQNLLLDPPTHYGQRDNIRRILGIKDTAVLDMLLSSPRVARHIDQSLTDRLGILPEMSEEEKRFVDTLLLPPPNQFRELARVVAVLSQAKVVKRTFNGATLAAVASFVGSREILSFIRDTEFPVFQGLLPSMELDEDILKNYAKTAEGFMFGLLPRNYQLRLLLQRPQGQFCGGLAIAEPNAREALKALITAAWRYLAEHKATSPDAESADEDD